MAEASDFKFGRLFGLAKSHHKITPTGKNGHDIALGALPDILRFHFNIYTMAEASDYKFGTQLGFANAKAHHKTTPREKVGVVLS